MDWLVISFSNPRLPGFIDYPGVPGDNTNADSCAYSPRATAGVTELTSLALLATLLVRRMRR